MLNLAALAELAVAGEGLKAATQAAGGQQGVDVEKSPPPSVPMNVQEKGGRGGPE